MQALTFPCPACCGNSNYCVCNGGCPPAPLGNVACCWDLTLDGFQNCSIPLVLPGNVFIPGGLVLPLDCCGCGNLNGWQFKLSGFLNNLGGQNQPCQFGAQYIQFGTGGTTCVITIPSVAIAAKFAVLRVLLSWDALSGWTLLVQFQMNVPLPPPFSGNQCVDPNLGGSTIDLVYVPKGKFNCCGPNTFVFDSAYLERGGTFPILPCASCCGKYPDLTITPHHADPCNIAQPNSDCSC